MRRMIHANADFDFNGLTRFHIAVPTVGPGTLGRRGDGMIAAMSDAPLNDIVALLDDAPLDDLIGVVEVLAQEGVKNLSLPAAAPDLKELVSLYGQQVRLGAHGPMDNPAALVNPLNSSALPNVKISAVIPSMPKYSRLFFSLMAGTDTATPGRLILLLLETGPATTTSQSTSVGETSKARSPTLPSSIRTLMEALS